MLQLSGTLLNRPILSLRSGTPIGTALAPIINPNNLKIEGFYCSDLYDKKRQPVLLYQDIRDVIKQGIAVNDQDALTDPEELIRLKNIMKLHFTLIDKPVVTISKSKVGKVNDFAVEAETMYIQKLYVGQNILKSLTGGTLSVDRSQILEITNRRVVIADLENMEPFKAAVPVS